MSGLHSADAGPGRRGNQWPASELTESDGPSHGGPQSSVAMVSDRDRQCRHLRLGGRSRRPGGAGRADFLAAGPASGSVRATSGRRARAASPLTASGSRTMTVQVSTVAQAAGLILAPTVSGFQRRSPWHLQLSHWRPLRLRAGDRS